MRPGRMTLLSFVFAMIGFGMLIQAEDAVRGTPSEGTAARILSAAPGAAGLPAGNMLSPEALLKPDGTLALDRGLNGAVDLRGWNVALDGRRGPVLTPQPFAPDSTMALTWSPFANHGLDKQVYALAVIGTDLYVGGEFKQTADGSVTNLNGIAKYSGGVWSALAHNGLGGAPPGYVETLAVIGTDLYVGGEFKQTADGGVTNLNNMARYSGGVWSTLPNKGLDGRVWALAVVGADLYVGGEFKQTADGSVPGLNCIATYSGGAWSPLANKGLDDTVYAFAMVGTDLYVGGDFKQTADGGVTGLGCVAKYSGGVWSALANNGLTGAKGGAYALAVMGTDLYVGGEFKQTADGSVTGLANIARYSGGVWSALANKGLSKAVNVMAVSGTDLYVGGGFTQTADGSVTNLNHIAQYSGGVWSALANSGVNGAVEMLQVSGTDLYVGGSFTQTADGVVTNLNNIARLTPGPTITSVTSRTGRPGKPATIKGGGFSATKTDSKVYFGRYLAAVTRATTTKLTVKIPTRCRSGRTYGVYVKVKGIKSNTVQFKVR